MIFRYLPTFLKMSRVTPNPTKALFRNEVSARIASLSPDEKKAQSLSITEKVTNHTWYKSSQRIALYMSTDSEVDTTALLQHIEGRGAKAFVPQYAGGRMKMLQLHAGDTENMEITKHGIAQHSFDEQREDALDSGLDLIIAPGLAFTESGARLGHGGGYYDRYLSEVRLRKNSKVPKVIALAFKCQMYKELPTDELDQPVDEVIAAD